MIGLIAIKMDLGRFDDSQIKIEHAGTRPCPSDCLALEPQSCRYQCVSDTLRSFPSKSLRFDSG